ncbi:MAG: pyruvate formate-lyase [Clostridia bacterium]|nr:pyruvate formate-lyase [Clostridia bacterium]
MTERVRALRRLIVEEKAHHAHRRAADVDPAVYRRPALRDFQRTALRLKTFLEAETPVILPGERIAFLRTLPDLPGIYTDEEWAAITAAHYIHEQGRVCNLSADYEKIIKKGLNAVLREIDAADSGENRAYYDAMRMSLRAVLDLTARYAQLARSEGREDIAAVLDRVPAQPARTLREALQSLRVLHYCMWCEGDYHNTLGRFDQYMYPYYKRDLEAGLITKEEAADLIEEFFLSCNRDSDLYTGMQQGDNGQSIVLGGMTPEGGDGCNELTVMCLEASAELKVIDPKLNLRVNRNTPLSLYEQGTRLTKLGLGFPQYENDDVVIPGLVKLGYEEKDARNYVVAACWEFILPGVGMDIPNIGALPFTGVVNRVIREQLGRARDMEALKAAVREAIFAEVRSIAASFHDLYVIPSPYLSIFFEGCVEKGQDIASGCKYNNFGLHGTGLATAADSLAAVQEMVFGRGLAPETLIAAMDANFEGYDELHYQLKYECPKMGNDEDAVDEIACFLLDAFADAVEGLKNERGGIFRAGTGSAMYYIWHAAKIGATADGRLAEEPLPANYAPTLNTRLNGPASLIRSFTKPDLSRVVNGGPLTIEFHDSVFRDGEAIAKVAQLVRSFVLNGGHQLQLNTVNRERMLDAQKHPENYKNLIVRVWGWSGYFVELDKCYQDHIIQRVELMIGA